MRVNPLPSSKTSSTTLCGLCLRLSPTEHPKGDPNAKKVAHSAFAYETHAPTNDAIRGPILRPRRGGTQICVASLRDAISRARSSGPMEALA